MEERTFYESVWCFNYMRCGAIGDPGWKYGGEVELCVACEEERLKVLERAAVATHRHELGGES